LSRCAIQKTTSVVTPEKMKVPLGPLTTESNGGFCIRTRELFLHEKLFVLYGKYILTSKATNFKCRPLKLKSGVKSKPVMKRNVIIIRIEINCFRHVSKNAMFSQMSRIFIWVWLARSVTNVEEQCGWEPIHAVYIRT
jgi:hypothetical protein